MAFCSGGSENEKKVVGLNKGASGAYSTEFVPLIFIALFSLILTIFISVKFQFGIMTVSPDANIQSSVQRGFLEMPGVIATIIFAILVALWVFWKGKEWDLSIYDRIDLFLYIFPALFMLLAPIAAIIKSDLFDGAERLVRPLFIIGAIQYIRFVMTYSRAGAD